MRRTVSCSAFESMIALYVEGDLRDADRRRVEQHLESCSDCWDLLYELQESQSAVKSLRQGAVNPEALLAVRSRVLNEVGDMEPAPAWAVAMHRLLFAGMRRRTAIAGLLVGALLLSGI